MTDSHLGHERRLLNGCYQYWTRKGIYIKILYCSLKRVKSNFLFVINVTYLLTEGWEMAALADWQHMSCGMSLEQGFYCALASTFCNVSGKMRRSSAKISNTSVKWWEINIITITSSALRRPSWIPYSNFLAARNRKNMDVQKRNVYKD